ncbi:MAG TPA: sulfatase-like hydrolase/transferase, partial [Chitinophagales bacterium]|nr:sulfatase-like hydrolase/transferase [Chitinophagales bacterium]
MKYLLPLFLFLFIASECVATCNLPSPAGLKATSVISCQASFKWKKVSSAAGYHVQYRISTAPNWTTLNITGNITSCTILNLDAATTYNIRIAAVCNSGEEGIFSLAININTASCSTPVNLSVSAIAASTATVTWNALCGETNFSLRYRKTGTTAWTTVSNINTLNYQLSGLVPSTPYQVRVRAKCGPNPSDYSPIVNFTTSGVVTPSRKNVLLVIIDDARFDSYQANGGPAFFQDTTISRVANEGVNFQLGFPAQSQCAPSRASITTGLYPHLHGVTDNPPQTASDTITQITLPQILHNNGYYTGLIGKYHVSKHPQPGYDFWMEVHGNDYTDTKFNINGETITIPGHITDVVADSAIGFFHKVPQDQPFYLWLAYAAPHTPFIPRPEDAGVFNGDVMPSPVTPAKYNKNYPGFIYNCHSADNPNAIPDFYEGYYEMLNGVEETLGKVFNELTTMGLMDSTLIIFMSDNGYMIGEHKLLEKQLAYEESIKVPIFMRYPQLISPGQKVNNNLAMNIDIAPTILD